MKFAHGGLGRVAPLRYFLAMSSLWLGFLFIPGYANAINVPPHIATVIANAHLSGSGSFRYFGFHLYDAQLWVGDEGDVGNQTDAPFAIDLAYARSFKGVEIAKTSRDEIARMRYGTDAQQTQWFEQMHKLFPDIEAGQHITGVFVLQDKGDGSRAGVKFFLDGRALGSIDDVQFARAFAAIWLDPRTRAASLRLQLLGAAH